MRLKKILKLHESDTYYSNITLKFLIMSRDFIAVIFSDSLHFATGKKNVLLGDVTQL